MGDRTAVSVEIGGRLPKSALAELIEAIEYDQMALDWGGEPPREGELLASLKPGECLRLVQSETYASIDAIAAVAKAHGLFWRMCWDAYPGSFDAGGELVDAAGWTDYPTNGTDGEVLLSAKEIKALGSWDAVTARLARLTQALPAFELTEE